jgi:hypothetical protein
MAKNNIHRLNLKHFLKKVVDGEEVHGLIEEVTAEWIRHRIIINDIEFLMILLVKALYNEYVKLTDGHVDWHTKY